MTDWARLFVSHCQYIVSTVPGASGMDIYTLGDNLLYVRGPNDFTGFCGLHRLDRGTRPRPARAFRGDRHRLGRDQ